MLIFTIALQSNDFSVLLIHKLKLKEFNLTGQTREVILLCQVYWVIWGITAFPKSGGHDKKKGLKFSSYKN